MPLGQLLVVLCDPKPNPLFDVDDHAISERIFKVREKGSLDSRERSGRVRGDRVARARALDTRPRV